MARVRNRKCSPSILKNILLLLDTKAQNVQEDLLLLGPWSSLLLSCGCRMLSHAHITHVNQSPFHRDMCNRMTFFTSLVSYIFSTHMWLNEKPALHPRPPPPSTYTLYSVSGRFAIYTRTEEKFEEGKGVTGPILLAVCGLSLSFPLIHHCPP